jgi:hypothetical protein
MFFFSLLESNLAACRQEKQKNIRVNGPLKNISKKASNGGMS